METCLTVQINCWTIQWLQKVLCTYIRNGTEDVLFIPAPVWLSVFTFPQTDQPVGKHKLQPALTCILSPLEPVAISYVHNDICLGFQFAFIWLCVCYNSVPTKWCFLRKFIAWHSVYGGLRISAGGFNLLFFSLPWICYCFVHLHARM